jgi:uncharacterized protein YbaR (Trm112 family)
MSAALGPLGLSRVLWEVLACPLDQGQVEADEVTGEIVCLTCGTRFPVLDGIPVMLPDSGQVADGRS